jgi:hypothetical protein
VRKKTVDPSGHRGSINLPRTVTAKTGGNLNDEAALSAAIAAETGGAEAATRAALATPSRPARPAQKRRRERERTSINNLRVVDAARYWPDIRVVMQSDPRRRRREEDA